MQKLRVLLTTLTFITILTIPHFSFSQFTDKVPLPDNINMVRPDQDIDPSLTRFSGKWVGRWDDTLGHILVVEDIKPPFATVIYAYGTAPMWGIHFGGWYRVQGKFVEDRLELTLPTTKALVTYGFKNGVLEGTYSTPRFSSKTKLTKSMDFPKTVTAR